MTTAPESRNSTPPVEAVDVHARRLHAAALAQVSPDALARLRRARQAATAAGPRRRPLFAPLLAGGAVAATLALAVVLRPDAPPPAGPSMAAVAAQAAPDPAATEPDPAETLQDDPGFYVWLGSPDGNAIAME
ncbi:MAG: hypothetical protein LCH59_11725 [Proteobacteria bacterium]|nr:hypothetical protein [Pseudomonadota bacterium]